MRWSSVYTTRVVLFIIAALFIPYNLHVIPLDLMGNVVGLTFGGVCLCFGICGKFWLKEMGEKHE